jgi:hypothetical protein
MISSSQPYNLHEQRNRALRLIFNYRGTQVQLASQQQVEMISPPSDPIDEYEEHSGFWIELRDSEESVVYRQVMHNPIQLELEAPSGDPERPFTNVKNDTDEGTFMVIVPDIEQAITLTLHSSPVDEPAGPAREIVRIDLKQTRSKPRK